MRQLTWVGATALVLISTVLWLWAASMTRRWIFAEHGAMENFQVVCLVFGAAVLAWQAFAARQTQERILFAALTLFFATFAIREFDVRKGEWSPVLVAVLSGTARNLWLGSLWLLLGGFAYRYRANLLLFGWKWLRSPAGDILLVAGLFWVVAAGVDKADPFSTRRRNLLAEELIEANAALLMAFSAIISLARLRPTQPEAATSQWIPAEAQDDPA